MEHKVKTLHCAEYELEGQCYLGSENKDAAQLYCTCGRLHFKLILLLKFRKSGPRSGGLRALFFNHSITSPM